MIFKKHLQTQGLFNRSTFNTYLLSRVFTVPEKDIVRIKHIVLEIQKPGEVSSILGVYLLVWICVLMPEFTSLESFRIGSADSDSPWVEKERSFRKLFLKEVGDECCLGP